MRDKILELLKSGKDFLSGEMISHGLGISRNAVWKHVNALRDEGYEIESVRNKGYRLVSSGNIINEREIADGLDTRLLGKYIVYMDEVDSTSEEAKRQKDMPDGTLFVAEVQSAGKGRRGRKWTSARGDGIFMSLLLKPEIDMRDISQVTLAVGIGVCRALRECAGIEAQIKWPNDIVCQGKKICGILTEMTAEIDRVEYLVCGIGINVNQKSFGSELSKKASSLCILAEHKFERTPIIQSALRHIEDAYMMFLKSGFSTLQDDYRALCVTLGREVRVIRGGEGQTAFARDVNERGELLVERDGREFAVSSGEVSVRGIYGYI